MAGAMFQRAKDFGPVGRYLSQMRPWLAQLALPVHAWLPLGLAALAPLLLAAVIVPLSRRRGRGIATALALRTVLVLAVGFATLAAVATVAVVRTGLRELHQRHV